MSELKEFTTELNKTFDAFKKENNKSIEEMKTRNGEATAETSAKVEKINADITEIRKAITEIEVKANRPSFDSEGKEIDIEERKASDFRKNAFIKYLRYGLDADGVDWTPKEKRALSNASDGAGNFLCPTDYEDKIIMNAYNMGELRPICQVGTTGRDSVTLGMLSKPAVAWGRQNLSISTQSLTAGIKRIQIMDLKALLTVSNNTLDDSAADVESELIDAFGRAVAEAEDNAFAAGAGDDNPQGVIACAAVQANYVATGVADAISDTTHNGIDAFISMLYKIKKTYRKNGTFAFNSNTEAEVRKLKDGNGNYYWQAPVSEGRPAMLLGKPIVNPEGLADIAAGAFPAVFGDFNAGYKIRDRKGISIQRLVEKYAEYDQVGFLCKSRVGGIVVLDEAFSSLKVAAS